MTTLTLKAAYIQNDIRNVIKNINEVVELVTFASEVWEENTEELSKVCIKVTHKVYSMMVCFVLYLVNDGTIAKASHEVMEDMGAVRVGESAVIIRVFIEGFVMAFLEVVELVEVLKVTLVSTLVELKIVAKGLKVPSYASFKSIDNLQRAIDKVTLQANN